jgi:hypothetical protein
MAQILTSLDNWVSDLAETSDGDTRQLLSFFQRDWVQGHRVNPLLFPLQQTVDNWRQDFEWFATVENHKTDMPGDEDAIIAPDQKTMLPIPEDGEDQTIILNTVRENSSSSSPISETVIMPCDQTEIVSPDSGINLDEDSDSALDDLGTLIMEAQHEESEACPGNVQPARTAISAKPLEPTSSVSTPSGKKNHITRGSGPDSTNVTHSRNVNIEKTPTPDDAMKKTVIPKDMTKTPKPPQAVSTETSGRQKPSDLELDLNDLDTMVWLDDKENKDE